MGTRAKKEKIRPGDLIVLETLVGSVYIHRTRQMLADDQVGEFRLEDVALVLATSQTGFRLLVLNQRGELGWTWADQLTAVT